MSQPSSVENRRWFLQGTAQLFYDLPDRFLVTAIPAPLTLLGGLDQSRLRKNRHVMGDGWLGEVHTLLNVSSAEAGEGAGLCRGGPFLQGSENSPPCGIGNGVQSAVE